MKGRWLIKYGQKWGLWGAMRWVSGKVYSEVKQGK